MSDSSQPTLYIQADNVHVGGGRSLLNALIRSEFANHASLLLDARMPLDLVSPRQSLKIISPTIFGRITCQLWLWRKLLSTDILLCFGNLPPLFNVKGKVVVFVQNRYVIDDVALGDFSFKVRMRLFLERKWFSSRCHTVNEFIVQTPSMEILLRKHLSRINQTVANKTVIKILPFIGDVSSDGITTSEANQLTFKQIKFDFIYPASGELHKNHQNLIDAFIILAHDGYFPSLLLTLDEKKFSEPLKSIQLAKEKFSLNIHNMGFLPHGELLELYSSVRCLIYPSLYESFGVPLIEANRAGLSIVAGELDYVRDSIIPDQSFDPSSALSIARAIKRSLGVLDKPVAVLSADEFLSKINSPI